MYLQVGLFFPWLIPLYFDGWLFLSNENSSSTCYHLSFPFLNMNKNMFIYKLHFDVWEVFSSYFYTIFLLFCSTGVLFCAWVFIFSTYRSACYWACSRSTWRQKSRMTSQWETTSGSSTRSTSTITSQSGEGPSKTGGRAVKKAPLTQSAFFNYFPTVFCGGTK